MTQKHTALPWFLEGNWSVNSKNVGGWLSAFPPSGMPVFEMVPAVGTQEQIIANAEFIVRACNSHYELLEALKAQEFSEMANHKYGEAIARHGHSSDEAEFAWKTAMSAGLKAKELRDAAIAKAEGGAA